MPYWGCEPIPRLLTSQIASQPCSPSHSFITRLSSLGWPKKREQLVPGGPKSVALSLQVLLEELCPIRGRDIYHTGRYSGVVFLAAYCTYHVRTFASAAGLSHRWTNFEASRD